MGRRFYCDYCDRRIPPGLNHRKNHNKGSQHIQNKRIYYQQFQDPIEILVEERLKRNCNQWKQTGSCSFGENCKYSHRSNYQLMQLIESESFSKNFDVNRWIQKKLSKEIILPESLVS